MSALRLLLPVTALDENRARLANEESHMQNYQRFKLIAGLLALLLCFSGCSDSDPVVTQPTVNQKKSSLADQLGTFSIKKDVAQHDNRVSFTNVQELVGMIANGQLSACLGTLLPPSPKSLS